MVSPIASAVTVLGPWAERALHLPGITALAAGFRVRRGEGGDVIPQIARLGSLAVLHKSTAGSGSGTLLTSLSRFNLAPGPGVSQA